jgi:hypothetical protein
MSIYMSVGLYFQELLQPNRIIVRNIQNIKYSESNFRDASARYLSVKFLTSLSATCLFRSSSFSIEIKNTFQSLFFSIARHVLDYALDKRVQV